MCALLIALMIFGAVILAGLVVCLYCLLKISATADETARRILCIAISKGRTMKRLLKTLGVLLLLLTAAFALSLLNDGVREWLFNLIRSNST